VSTESDNDRVGQLIVSELVALGVPHFCIAPGSRSTPLAAAIIRHPGAEVTVFTDERSASFFALGVGRATGRPAVVITTSGTAVANCHPAAVEAKSAGVPLLLLTADRPPELRDTGANQTIDQIKFFGDSVVHFTALPCPTEAMGSAALRSTIDTAFARASAGPVHINSPFREPLGGRAPSHSEGSGVGDDERHPIPRTVPHTRFLAAERCPSPDALDQLAVTLSSAHRGLLIIGGIDDPKIRAAAEQLAGLLGWPVCADITSGLRIGSALKHAVTPFDLLLRCREFRDAARPEAVLHIGGSVVSKRLHDWIAETGASHIRVAPGTHRLDPRHSVTCRIDADLVPLVRGLTERLKATPDEAWRDRLVDAGSAARAALVTQGEALVARIISEEAEGGVFAAASMGIRNLDVFGTCSGPARVVSSNRGASGIDGCVATAAGWSQGEPTTLLIGDQALLHDLSSLPVLREHRVTVVVVNNGGGAIFRFLPISAADDVFEQAFTGPASTDLAGVAQALGLGAIPGVSVVDFADAYRSAQRSGVSTLIEVVTQPGTVVEEHEAMIAPSLIAAAALLNAAEQSV